MSIVISAISIVIISKVIISIVVVYVKLFGDKHSSLLPKSINYGRRKVNSTDPMCIKF